MKDLKQRLLDGVNIDEVTGCWDWQRSLRNGYGAIKVDGKVLSTHRLAIVVFKNQQIPADKEVCHTCDNPKCINPVHLFIGTRSENMKDAQTKGRLTLPEGNKFQQGYKPPQRSLTDKKVKKIKRDIERFYPVKKSLKEIAEMNNIPAQRVRDMRRKKPQAYFNVI